MKLAAISIFVIIVAVIGFFAFKDNNTSENQAKTTTEANSSQQIDSANQSQVLAGTTSQYKTFTRAEYDKAIADGKIVFLDFYANWCPICRAENPEIVAGFSDLSRADIVGFRVNFKDDETSEEEKNLAKEFSIPYQHTKVILKNGKEVKRSGNEWDKGKLLEELNNI